LRSFNIDAELSNAVVTPSRETVSFQRRRFPHKGVINETWCHFAGVYVTFARQNHIGDLFGWQNR
jgi:hypothetical protein